MTKDERWKVNLLTLYPCWFIYHSVSSHQTVLQRSATLQMCEPNVSNFCNLELAHQNIWPIQLITFLWWYFCLCSLFYLLIWFIAGNSCLRNNILNIPAPALPEYNFFYCQVSTSGNIAEAYKSVSQPPLVTSELKKTLTGR